MGVIPSQLAENQQVYAQDALHNNGCRVKRLELCCTNARKTAMLFSKVGTKSGCLSRFSTCFTHSPQNSTTANSGEFFPKGLPGFSILKGSQQGDNLCQFARFASNSATGLVPQSKTAQAQWTHEPAAARDTRPGIGTQALLMGHKQNLNEAGAEPPLMSS